MAAKATIKGVDPVVVRFKEYQKRIKTLRRAWRSVGRYLSGEFRKQFTSQGAYFGKPWAPLDPQYRAWKSVHYPGRKILVQSGSLRDSLTHRPMGVERYHLDSAEFGSDDPKAIFHQRGTRRGIPPRPMVVVNQKMRTDITDILAKYITDGRVES